jgi:stage III sporulation protein AC
VAKKNEDPTKSYQQWTAENTEPNKTPVQAHDSNYQAVGAGSQTNAQTEQMKPDDQAMLKAAGIGMIVATVCQILTKSGRDEQATLVSIAGVVVLLLMVVGEIGEILASIREIFGI